MPPEADDAADPLDCPHVALMILLVETDRTLGSVMITLICLAHPFWSRAYKICGDADADKPVINEVVCHTVPFAEYSYGLVPPPAFRSTVPLGCPWHNTGVIVPCVNVKTAGSVSVAELDAVQLFASVMVTE